jgi:hypothetical protein
METHHSTTSPRFDRYTVNSIATCGIFVTSEKQKDTSVVTGTFNSDRCSLFAQSRSIVNRTQSHSIALNRTYPLESLGKRKSDNNSGETMEQQQQQQRGEESREGPQVAVDDAQGDAYVYDWGKRREITSLGLLALLDCLFLPLLLLLALTYYRLHPVLVALGWGAASPAPSSSLDPTALTLSHTNTDTEYIDSSPGIEGECSYCGTQDEKEAEQEHEGQASPSSLSPMEAAMQQKSLSLDRPRSAHTTSEQGFGEDSVSARETGSCANVTRASPSNHNSNHNSNHDSNHDSSNGSCNDRHSGWVVYGILFQQVLCIICIICICMSYR